jgi:hypothetical protein
MVSVATAARACAAFSGEPAVPMTEAPRCVAICVT